MSPPNDPLAQINDNLARFFQHADQLLVEWKQHGEELRAIVEGEAGKLRSTLSTTLESAGREAARNIDVENALGDSVRRLRGELERLANGTAGLQSMSTTARRSPPWLLVSAITANIMLLAVIVLLLRKGDGGSSTEAREAVALPSPVSLDAAPPPADAAPRPDAAPPAAAVLCRDFLGEPSADRAKAFLQEATAELCGPDGKRAAEELGEALAPAPKKPRRNKR